MKRHVRLFGRFASRYGDSVKIVHFIGVSKPWHAAFDEATGAPVPREPHDAHASKHLVAWWQIYHQDVVREMGEVSKAVDQMLRIADPKEDAKAASGQVRTSDRAHFC